MPLQTSAAVAQLQPIVAETEPTLIASSIDFVDDAVELILTGPAPERLVVFDFRPEVDDQREAFEAAKARLAEAGSPVVVETLADALGRGARAPDARSSSPTAMTRSRCWSTPPAAPARRRARSTRRARSPTCGGPAANSHWDDKQGVLPAITLSFLPMSHVMGRGVLYGTLAERRHRLLRRQQRPVDLPRGPGAGPADADELRPAHLGHALPGVLEPSRPPRPRRRPHHVETEVLADARQHLLGGRFVSALTGSAPISPELKAWVEELLDMHLLEGYGSTEAGAVFVDGMIRRPPVIDYKLVDVPELGYFRTDRPHPRGELLVKSEQLFPGYYKRPEVTAEMFDEDGFYRTGDIVAELGPDHVQYVDRRNNVLKLSQGEFVTVSKLEAAFNDSPLVHQIYIYGNSARPYLLAVVVPTEDALSRHDVADLKPLISESLKEAARAADLQSYEIPRDFLIETTPFTPGERPADRHPQAGVAQAEGALRRRSSSSCTPTWPTARPTNCASCGGPAPTRPVLETIGRAAGALLGAAAADLQPDAQFTDLGGDSLSALTFANLLHEIFDVDVPVGVIVSPATDLAALAAYVEAERSGGAKRPTYDAVHGRDATEVHAADLTLDKFIDAATLAAAPALPGPSSEIRTVLLTGATGFLGRYLALEWLERMDLVDGKVICLVRAKTDAEARARLDATFDSGDPKLLAHYRELAAEHLEVIAGDKGEAEPRSGPGDLAAAGRQRRRHRRPRRAGEPCAAVQPAVRRRTRWAPPS